MSRTTSLMRRLAKKSWLQPPATAPHLPALATSAGATYDATTQQIARWLDEGLPINPDGRLDPFVLCNWLTDHPIHTPQLFGIDGNSSDSISAPGLLIKKHHNTSPGTATASYISPPQWMGRQTATGYAGGCHGPPTPAVKRPTMPRP